MPLETSRLHFAPWHIEDCAALRPIATDPDVMRYITGGVPWSDEQIQEFVHRQIGHHAQHGFCYWKLLDKSTGRLVGFCGLQPYTLDGANEIEIGWWLAKEQWGKGLATESARAALRFAMDSARFPRVFAIARPDNTASIRIMQKLGMTFDRATTEKSIPVVLYSIRASRPASP